MKNKLNHYISKYGKYATIVTLAETILVIVYFCIGLINLIDFEVDYLNFLNVVLILLKIFLIPIILSTNFVLGIITTINIVTGLVKKEDQNVTLGNIVCFVTLLIASFSIIIIFTLLHGYFVAINGGV